MTKARPILPRDWKLTLPEKGGDWTDKGEYDGLSRRVLTEQLSTVRSRGPLRPGEVAVICVLRNEAKRLSLFIEHYKKLGVGRFLMIDNNSDDGSREILLAEPRVDVFHTSVPFSESCFGLYWLNGLVREYCIGNWIVWADADELLVYDGMEKHDLAALARWLDLRELDRLFGIMLDVYPSGSIGRGNRTIAEILDDCWFDAEGYFARRSTKAWLMFGGSRHRLFEYTQGSTPTLISKYPFFKVTPQTSLCDSHYLWPFDTTTNAAFGALLHLKLMDDFARRSAVNEAEGQHWLNSLHYRRINESLDSVPDIVAWTPRSRRYTGPSSLVKHRIMSAIEWEGKTDTDCSSPFLAVGEIGWRAWHKWMPGPGKDWAQREDFNALSCRSLNEHLTTVRYRGPLQAGELGLICVLRNEIDRLPVFFGHYRKLGVTRFFIVDNDSSDGSHEFLLAQSDADIFFTRVPFREGQAGLYWANGIAREYCIGHWIVHSDADELLVYDGMEEHDLRQLAQWLDAGGLDRLFAPLLDIYPSGGLGVAQRAISDILEHDCWFDPAEYSLDRTRGGWLLTGGARQRLFGSRRDARWPTLSKYPFFRMSGETVIFSQHWLWPYDDVTEGAHGALLHLKLTDDLAPRAELYAREGQHDNESEDYRIISDILRERPKPVAFHEQSRRYRGSKSLVRQSFILPIDWRQPPHPDELKKRKEYLRPRTADRTSWIRTFPDEGRVWKNRDRFNWRSHSTLSDHMSIVRCRGPLAPGEVGVVCVLRNEVDRLPLFFQHYRKLGVSRFFMIDNNSDDGSHDIIRAEPQADIFVAHATYAEGWGGIYWANGIAREFCRGCWMLRVDADELFVYDRMEEKDLAQLGQWLAARSCDRLFALMIDVYPSGEIGRVGRSFSDILQSDCWFDSDGYEWQRLKGGWLVTGGPRHRLFNQGAETHQHWLSKYPFVHMSPETSIVDAHFLWPVESGKPAPRGALLHLKLMDDFCKRSERFVREGQHVQESRAYRIINEHLAATPKLTAGYSGSKRYESPQSLIRHGMMLPIDWEDNELDSSSP